MLHGHSNEILKKGKYIKQIAKMIIRKFRPSFAMISDARVLMPIIFQLHILGASQTIIVYVL